jgi:hypothetical protein
VPPVGTAGPLTTSDRVSQGSPVTGDSLLRGDRYRFQVRPRRHCALELQPQTPPRAPCLQVGNNPSKVLSR